MRTPITRNRSHTTSITILQCTICSSCNKTCSLFQCNSRNITKKCWRIVGRCWNTTMGELSFPTQGEDIGGMDWIKTCNDLQAALISSCDVLVNPDNTLTTEGERAVGCIRNGILLAGGGSILALYRFH